MGKGCPRVDRRQCLTNGQQCFTFIPMKRDQHENLARACETVGGKAVLAQLIGVTPQAMSQWVSGDRPLPAERCPLIERATRDHGKQVIRCEDLRPDVAWDVLREQAASESAAN